MLVGLLMALSLLAAAPEPGIAPGRVAVSPVRSVGGHRLVEQADGSWSNLDRRNGFVAWIEVDGQLRFESLDYGIRPAHAWYVQTRDPVTGQPAGMNRTVAGGGRAGDALGALITAGVFKGIELGSERRRDKPALTRPFDPRDRFALDTAEFRAELAERWYDARLQESLDHLDSALRSLWSDVISPKTRRKAIFELWNRFPEQLPAVPLHPPPGARSELELHRAEVARVGREAICSFVRSYLARGTKDAFGRLELRRLDEHRVGPEPFDPYAEPSSTRAR